MLRQMKNYKTNKQLTLLLNTLTMMKFQGL